MNITVDVKLMFDLKRYAPCGSMPFTMQIHEKATLGSLLEDLNIPPDPELVALLDGSPSGPETRLHANSRVTVFPLVMGG